MVFTVYACADIDGEKANFELGFNGVPSMHDLHVRTVEVFTRARREAGIGGQFQVAAIVMHNRATDSWEDLVAAGQLTANCQLYIFQPNHTDDMSKPLPKPLLPPAAVAPSREETLSRSARSTYSLLRSPSGNGESRVLRDSVYDRSAGDVAATPYPAASRPAGPPASAPRQIQLDDSLEGPRVAAPLHSSAEEDGREDAVAVFRMLDTDRDGIITLRALHDTMREVGADTSPDSVGDTFAFGDRSVTAAEFRNFGAAYPRATRDLRARLERAGPRAVLASPAPASRPPPNPSGPVGPSQQRPSPVRRRPEPAQHQRRPVSPAVSHAPAAAPPPSSLDSRLPPPASPGNRPPPPRAAPSVQGRSLLQTAKPLSAMEAAELDSLELQLLRLLEDVRRKRAAFDEAHAHEL